MRRCSKCGIARVQTAFSKQKDSYSGKFYPMSTCKACCTERAKKAYKKESIETRAKRKARFYQRTYGITIDDYNAMFTEQKGLCPGCNKHQSECEKALVVDHNHATNQVRGLLCAGCNLALGNIKENPETLEKLAIYIRRFK